MSAASPENLLMGALSLGLVPWIGWTVARGLRSGRLPVGRAFLVNEERPSAFRALLVLYIFAALGMGWIGVDLLTGGALSG